MMYTYVKQLLTFDELEKMELNYKRLSDLDNYNSTITITYTNNNELIRNSCIYTIITSDKVLYDIAPSLYINDELHHKHSEKRQVVLFHSNNIKFIIKKDYTVSYTQDRTHRKEKLLITIYY